MFINRTINKKFLETLIHETYSSKNLYITECLLDALKNIGFHYATNSGLSISIEDLKTPLLKEHALSKTNRAIMSISEKWERGVVTDAERFQTIIDTWTQLAENLKKQIVAHYQKFDPLNSLYVMAFSGARGNISQVGQLIGMRGLMADQNGQIIDLPIQSNFREGLTSTDYLVSSYGARKGLVDTALKTADAGYLTRRLIYLAQDLIVRLNDCKTTSGVSVVITCKDDLRSIFGRSLISSTKNNATIEYNNCLITSEALERLHLSQNFPFSLKIRSILTCKAHGSVCRVCYGWDLAERSLIALGEAVGVIAAQSIGEPGTQLTMRTFHTGGVFAGETMDHILAPFSGWVSIPKKIKKSNFRTAHGENAIELKEKAFLRFVDWKLSPKDVELSEGSLLYLNSASFVKNKQIIGEYKRPSLNNTKRRLMPIRTPFSGELFYTHTKTSFSTANVEKAEDKNIIWIASGKVLSFPTQGFYAFPQKLTKEKAFGLLKVVTPFSGYIELEHSKLYICSARQRIELSLDAFELMLEGCTIQFSVLVKNYQYVDEQTVLALLYIFPKEEGEIYLCKKKSTLATNLVSKLDISNLFYQEELLTAISEFFFITTTDTWTLCTDQVKNINFNATSGYAISSGQFFHKNIKSGNSGFFLKRQGLHVCFQNAYPIFLGKETRLGCQEGEFIFNKQIIASQVRTTLRTEDIVQGIPKVSALIEAYQSKKPALIAPQTGLLYKLAFDQTDRPEIKAKSSNSIHRMYNIRRYGQNTDKLLQLIVRVRQFKRKNAKDKCCITMLNENFYLEENSGFTFRCLPKAQLNFQKHLNFVVAGQQITEGPVDPHELLDILLKAESSGSPLMNPNYGIFDGRPKNKKQSYALQLAEYPEQVQRALTKFRILLANSILGIYHSQGVIISSTHLELITSQLTSKAVIKNKVGIVPTNQFGLYAGEIINLVLATEIYNSYLESENENDRLCPPIYIPKYSSATRLSSTKDGFLAPAAFQETKKALTKAAIYGKCDWLRNLKENIIVGRAIPAGTTYFNLKDSLDANDIFNSPQNSDNSF